MRQEIEAAVDQGAMAGEHDDGQILALALGHVAAGARERFADLAVVGQSVGACFGREQEIGIDLGVEAALVAEQGAGDVVGVLVGELQTQVLGLVAIVADADGEHMQARAGGLGGSGGDLDGASDVGEVSEALRFRPSMLPRSRKPARKGVVNEIAKSALNSRRLTRSPPRRY